MEQVTFFLFLRQHISEDLGRSRNTTHIIEKAQHHLFFLRTRRRNKYPPSLLKTYGQDVWAKFDTISQC